eukprot:3718868-Pyramimonas_sp.AAC.1
MRLHLRAAVFRGLEWDAGARWDVPHRLCFDVVKHCLRSKKFSAFEKGCIRAAATNAVWTRQKARDLGYDVS